MDYHSYVLASFLILLVVSLAYKFSHPQPHVASQSVPAPQQNSSHRRSETLREEEQELIRNIRDFQDGIIREVMIPRIDSVAVEESMNLKEFRLLVLESGHSRIPVYRDTIDQIVGIAYVKDMLHHWDADESAVTVSSFMRQPYFVPETKNIGALLHEFQAKKVHIAVAIDEYGGTAGIVTIEDLLEVIFGEIVDEHDEDEEELITVINDTTFAVNAKASIDELEDYVGDLSIQQQDFDSVGGLLFSILGEIPEENTTVEYQHLRLTVLKADRHRVLQVKIEHIPEIVES